MKAKNNPSLSEKAVKIPGISKLASDFPTLREMSYLSKMRLAYQNNPDNQNDTNDK
ncbi:MAG: hypothetical protein HFH56_10105 [Lachnospiraceae bacterium]|jgi:hypothetical protein|nr:hypothetical protein [Lachnospiraceae bacterium]